MFKNRNKWFYAFIVATALLVAAAVAIVVISVNRPKPQEEIQIPEGAETGVYYYSVEQGEVILSLNNGNKFTIAGTNMNRSGTYTVDGQNVAFTFVTGSDVATAVLGDNVVTMTFNGNVMTFLKQINYTVTFDTAGGDTVEPVQVVNGKHIAAPADPAKEGHVFIGWYADAACKTAYQFADPISADTVVYAGWVKKEVGAVEFVANFDLGYEGAEQLAAMETINGKLYNIPAPERSGYTFGGWFISMYEDGQKLTAKCDENTVLTADTTLFAVWHEASGAKLPNPDVSVTGTGLSWNAVSGASSYQVKILNAKGEIVHEVPLGATSMNFDFAALEAGDYTVEVVAVANNTANNSDAAVRYFRNKALDRVSKFQVINGMLIFNAVENAENYLITIDCGNKDHNHVRLNNGGSTVYNFANCYMQKGGIRFTVVATAKGYADSVEQSFVYERSLAAVENLQFDARNDQFIWDMVENAAGYIVTVTIGEETYTFENGVNNYFSTAAYTGEIFVSVVPVTTGYNSPDAATANCTKTAPAAPQNVRVDGMVITWDEVAGATKYEVKIGSTTYEVTTNSVDLVEKKFDASVGENYTILVKAIAGSEGSSYSKALTVQYKILDTNLSYKANKVYWTPVLGGTNFDVRVNGGEAVRISGVNYAPIVLTKAGINLIEVRCADLSSGEWVALEVYAYEVTYYSRTLAGEAREYVAIGDSLNMPQDYTNEGYNFAGWYNTPGAANGNGMEYTSAVFTGNGNMALYANWSPKQYDIIFNVDGNVSNIVNESTEKVTYTKHFTLTPAETDNPALGYFVGWYTAPGGAGTQVTDSLGNSVLPYDVVGPTHVYPYFANALSYELLSDGTYAVKQGPGIANKNVTEIVIPATYNDIPVTQILDNGFIRCSNIVSVKLPDTITRIGIGAFDICNNLESVEVYVVDPNSTAQKFYASSNGALLYFDEASGNTYLEFFPRAKTGTYVVPEEVDNIRPYAFKYSRIEKVIISKGVTMIAESAFYQCTKLHTIEFEFEREESVTITVDAFQGLTRVETLILPAKLNVIEDIKTLDKLEALKTIVVEEGGDNYSAKNNLLCDGAGTALLYVPNSFAGVFEAPMGIQSIGDGVFTGKASITEVIIPAYVSSVGASAFESCSGLSKVTVNGPRNNDLTIGENAFAACAILEEILFEGGSNNGNGFITIGTSAFAGCEMLDKLTVGENVNIALIGDYAFHKDTALNELNFAESAEILSIGQHAFEQCLSIKEYVVHASTTSVGSYAFSGCSYLEAVEFAPNGGQVSFGQGVFQDCVRLTTIKLPATLSGFDGSVFDGCEHINNIEVDPANPYLETFNGALYTMGKTELVYYPRELSGDLSQLPWDTLTKIGPAVFKSNPNVTSVVIGAGITEIGAGAFDSCINLTSVTFANLDGAMVIGDNAFSGCTQITEITIPAQTTSIGAKAFYMTKLNGFTIPETVTSIGAQAFAYTNIPTIHIPAAVTFIGQGAFYKAASLSTITFAGGEADLVLGGLVELPEEEAAQKTFDGTGMFVGTALTTVTLPANVSFIGDYTFHDLASLTAVTIPDGSRLNYIGRNAFYKTGITTINLVEGVKELGEYALALTKLTTVTIPSTMEHIRAYALSTNTLTEILFTEGTAEVGLSIYNHAFVGTAITEINLPAHLNMIGERNDEFLYRMVWDVFHQTTGIPTGMTNNTKLTKVHVTEGGKYYGSKDGILYEKAETGELIDLLFCPSGNTGDIIIPNTVIHVQHSAFINSQLTSVVFEEFDKEDPRYGTQILTIGDWSGTGYTCPVVFGGESSSSYQTPLKLIQLPSHLKFVASRAFTGLSKPNQGVAELVIEFNPDSTVGFGQACMRNNSAIKVLHLPKVESTALQSFYGLSNLTELTFAPGSTFANVADRCFESIGVENFVLPASVSSLGEAAFRGARITNLTQEEGGILDSIGYQCFASCSNLVTFKIPDTVTVVAASAFYSCSKLEVLEVSANMQNASGIVQSCNKLREVRVPEDHPYLMSDDGVLYDKQQTILFIYPAAKGAMTKAIPDSVHTIDAFAFYNYTGTSIQLPANLRYINSYAFQYAKLTSIHIPAKVEYIGDYAFANIGVLTSITFAENSALKTIGGRGFNSNGATEIILPDSVESLGDDCFRSSPNLKKIVLGAGMRTLGSYAIAGCAKLETIVMQEGLVTVGNRAFAENGSLRTVTIPDTVTSIGDYCFYAASYASTKSVLESVLMSEHSMLTSIGQNAFYNCSALKKVTFGPSVEKVGKTIFYGCVSLEEVLLSDAMPEVQDKMFENCAHLRSVNIPASAKRIGENAFLGCAALPEIVISADVTDIAANAFSGCTALATATIESGSTLQTIADGAFENTTSLASISLPGSVVSIGNAAFKNSAINNAPLGNSLKRIGDEAFYGCVNLTSVGVPSSVTAIGKFAFAECSNVETLTLSVGLKNIGDFAFAGCSKLTEVNIPETVAFMGANPFANCTGLTNITIDAANDSFVYRDGILFDRTMYTLIFYPAYKTETTFEIPASVYEIAGGAFAGSQLETLVIPETIKAINESTFENSRKLASIVIPESVTIIGKKAFKGCAMLNNVTIPSSVTELGEAAFADCASLTNITLAERKTDIVLGSHLFEGCTSLTEQVPFPNMTAYTEYMYANTGVVNLVIPSYITTLEAKGVFANCAKLKTIQFPDGINTKMGGRFFYGCTALESVNLPAGITYFGTAGKSTTTESYPAIGEVFANCTSLKTVIINGTPWFYPGAFENCTSLINVQIKGGNIVIAERMFAGCTSLRDVSFLSNITNIDREAFAGCTGITGEVTLGSRVQLNNDSFNGCTNITKLVIGTVESITDYALRGLTSNTTVYFKTYKSADKIPNIGDGAVLRNTEAKIEFKKDEGGSSIDYSLTPEEQQMVERFCGDAGLPKEMIATVTERLVEYKKNFMEFNPGKELSKDEQMRFMVFCEENKVKLDSKMQALIFEQWVEYKQSLAKWLREQYALTPEEQMMAENFCAMLQIDKGMFETVNARLMAYKATFNDTVSTTEITKEEQEQLRMFLEEMKVKGDEKILNEIYKNWLTYKQQLAAANKPAAKSYLTEKELSELQMMCEKLGLEANVMEAIAAAWSDYKLNFTETKADKEISKEEYNNLLKFLMELGVDEKMASQIVDNYFREGMAQFKMQMAEKNAKAQLDKEEMEMITNFVKSMGLGGEADKLLQEKLFNYKRFFSETEIQKELTEEERQTFMALMEELGANFDEKMFEKIGGQWIEYKMKLVKTMA